MYGKVSQDKFHFEIKGMYYFHIGPVNICPNLCKVEYLISLPCTTNWDADRMTDRDKWQTKQKQYLGKIVGYLNKVLSTLENFRFAYKYFDFV